MAPRPSRQSRDAAREAVNVDSAAGKRKRRSSEAVKIVVPAGTAAPEAGAAVDANGDGASDPKRLRLSAKANGDGPAAGAGKRSSPEKKVSPQKALKKKGKVLKEGEVALSEDVREGLATIIAQMAVSLPPPVNGILGLWLPPDFKEVEENTLGWVLKQDTLTWEELVDVIHLFSQHLLVPCQYPNPVPVRSAFNLPVPPLPPHFPPHAIYSFCASLHSLLLQLQPTGKPRGFDVERWALVQKTPQAGDWFSGVADSREGEKLKEPGMSLVESLAAGSLLGNAQPVMLQSTVGGASGKVPTLSESIIRRASLKMNRWKEQRAARSGGFGSIARGVSISPAQPGSSFTPTFGPMFDSSYTTGGQGYFSTLEAMHERARHREWSKRVFKMSQAIEEGGWYGRLEEGKGKEKQTVEDLLAENSERITELQAWQEIRVSQGVQEVTQREHLVAEELLSSLSLLAGNVSPADLLPSSTSNVGLAHELSRRLLPVSAPAIRGTLDPRRPHALHDNVTVKPRSAPAAGSTPAPGPGLGMASAGPSTPYHAQPSPKIGGMAPPPNPQYSVPPPHTLPSGAPRSIPPQSPSPYNGAPPPSSSRPNGQPQPQYPPSRNAPYPSFNNTIYGRSPLPPPQPSPVAYVRPGPGPSGLRQSFGPGVPPPPGVYGSPSPGVRGGFMM
ncbi:hypothetical protein IAT38_000375 [Cryptococcus sp. DSM 104549]